MTGAPSSGGVVTNNNWIGCSTTTLAGTCTTAPSCSSAVLSAVNASSSMPASDARCASTAARVAADSDASAAPRLPTATPAGSRSSSDAAAT